MRHIGSFLLAAVFAPAIFLLTGTGLSAFESARRHAFVDDPLAPLAALGALLLAGLLYGILVMVRLSPVGPGLAGMVLFGLSTWALSAPAAYDTAFDQLGVHMGGAVGQWGLGFLLGVPLLATLTSPRRWRRNPYGGDVYYVSPTVPPAPSTLDATRRMPAQPAYLTVPDVAAPSLHYPQAPLPVTAPVPAPASPSAFSPPAAGPTGASTSRRTADPPSQSPSPHGSQPPSPRPADPPSSSSPAAEPPTVSLDLPPRPTSIAASTSSAASTPAAAVPPPAPTPAVPTFSHAAAPEPAASLAAAPPVAPSFSHAASTSGDEDKTAQIGLDAHEPTAKLEP